MWLKGSSLEPFNHIIQDTLQLSFSNLRKTGKGHFEQFGVTVTPFFQYYRGPELFGQDPNFYINLGLASSLTLPRLLPFSNPRGLTANLPITVGFSLFPQKDYFDYYYFSTVFLGTEIQWGIPGANLFLRRFSIQGRYTRYYKYNTPSHGWLQLSSLWDKIDTMHFTDKAVLSLVPEIGINTGALTYVGIELSLDLIFKKESTKTDVVFPISFAFSGRIRL